MASDSIRILNRLNHRCEIVHTWGVKVSGSIRNFNGENYNCEIYHIGTVKPSGSTRNFRENHCGNTLTLSVKLSDWIQTINRKPQLWKNSHISVKCEWVWLNSVENNFKLNYSSTFYPLSELDLKSYIGT